MPNDTNTLRQLRLNCGLSQKDLANQTHVHHLTIHAWETGRATPTPRNRRALANALGISIPALNDCLRETRPSPLNCQLSNDNSQLPIKSREPAGAAAP